VLTDAPLAMDRMRQAGAVEGLRRVEVAERSVTLVLSAALKAGTLLEYTLHFADGQPAEGVTLLLRVDSASAEPEVEVYRSAIPAAALKRQVAALNARMEALLAQEASLTPLLAAGLLGPEGVKSTKLKQGVRIHKEPGLSAGDTWLHIATGRRALEVTLTLAPGAPPWAPGEGQLTERSTQDPLPVRSVKLLGGVALQPGNTTRLLVEWDTPLGVERLDHILRVNEQNGERALSVWLPPPEFPAPAAPTKEKKP
jgi:uncharacterized protein (TIGR02268 family)